MRPRLFTITLLLVSCAICFDPTAAQEETALSTPATQVITIKPEFVPPSQILDFLGVELIGSCGILEWATPTGIRTVEIRHNDAANLLILYGDADDVDLVQSLIREADIPPRQIEIEVRIVEVMTSKVRDLGIDWQNVIDALTESEITATWRYSEHDGTHSEYVDVRAKTDLSDILKMLDESGAATIHNAPRILTLNNRRATILDGERVTYVTRYSSYTNLFETDSMDAGLTLSVVPSLGESGYITLRINAELTTLESSISGSPVKRGQMVENTVIVKDGQSVSLGGLSKTVEQDVHRRIPILGHILPFLFSHKTTVREEVESFIVLTPAVVDFAAAPD